MANNCVVIREIVSHNPTDYRFAIADTELQNGMVVTLGGLKDGYRDVYEASAPAAGTDELWIVTGVELVYDQKIKNYLPEYKNQAGKIVRVERVAAGITMALSVDGLNGAEGVMKAGSVVTADATNKLTVATSPGSNTQVGKVIDVFTRGGLKFVSICFG